jgi:DNA replication and repair protein RecF
LLVQLTCRSFRNLEELEWRPPAGCQLLSGPNGAGKTSLLEAIYLLATTRSFRSPSLADCGRRGAAGFVVGGEVDTGRRAALEVGWGPAGGLRRLNGSTSSLIEHLSVLPVVAWTSSQAELFTGPPGQRRKFVDQGIVTVRPAALESLTRYRRALRQKRRLLAAGGAGLAAWNRLLAGAACGLMRLRQQYLEEVARATDEVLRESQQSFPKIELHYKPSIPDYRSVESILAQLGAVAGRERQQRQPLIGPHRDEVEIRWAGQPVRRLASAGERKAAGMILTAARGRVLEARGERPVYLLDDADSELDEGRRAAVWELFSSARQLFLSSTRPELWRQARGVNRWLLEGGALRPG